MLGVVRWDANFVLKFCTWFSFIRTLDVTFFLSINLPLVCLLLFALQCAMFTCCVGFFFLLMVKPSLTNKTLNLMPDFGLIFDPLFNA